METGRSVSRKVAQTSRSAVDGSDHRENAKRLVDSLRPATLTRRIAEPATGTDSDGTLRGEMNFHHLRKAIPEVGNLPKVIGAPERNIPNDPFAHMWTIQHVS